MINPNGPSIEYYAESKLLDLAVQYTETSKKYLQRRIIDQAAQIEYYLEALLYKDYLEDTQINNIYECLKSIAQLFNYPVAPSVPDIPTPTIGTGPQGPAGPTGATGPTGPTGPAGADAAVSFLNSDVDTGTEVVDSFTLTTARAATWFWEAWDNGTKYRAGTTQGNWSGATIQHITETTPGIGSIGATELVPAAVINGSNIELQFTVTSNNWTIRGVRITY